MTAARTLALVLVGVLLIACRAPANPPAFSTGGRAAPTPAGAPITIGYLADTNGTSALIAAGMHLGTDLAVQQINGGGGINGRPVQVIYVDPQSDTAQATQLAEQLITQNNVDVLMGGVLSSECLAVQDLAARLKTIYLPTLGCAAEEFATRSCNRYAFRFQPVGRQTIAPLVEFIVRTYGKKWAMLYSDYEYGQSQLKAYGDELKKFGATITTPVGIPNNEPHLGPFVTRVPVDGSVNGVIINGLSAGDLYRASLALGQHRIIPGVQIVGNSGRDVYDGVYPDFLTGSVNAQTYISGSPPNNPYGEAYERAWHDMAETQPQWSKYFGGADRAMPFQGYPQYSTFNALKSAMVASHFSGRKDTEALLTALENVNLSLGPDAPGGAMMMNKQDHQGAQTVYVYRVSGPQQEELVASIPADQVPLFNTCHV
ncbi:MAG TPA: ABC transporter substrate-binding protein [Chloroflexota bacterium]|nr:ABC transporter substrate-binding protein [Chloroflexota bacterium]